MRESLVSIGRLVNFLAAECGDRYPQLREHTGTMATDIRSLTDHASYISNTSVFLLDATVGLITIDQNNIIKIVSVVSVVIMPPTLIASIYGMNFQFMPELAWPIGYPLALVAMLGAAILPTGYSSAAAGSRPKLAFAARHAPTPTLRCERKIARAAAASLLISS